VYRRVRLDILRQITPDSVQGRRKPGIADGGDVRAVDQVEGAAIRSRSRKLSFVGEVGEASPDRFLSWQFRSSRPD
jgi:hypothetical protein